MSRSTVGLCSTVTGRARTAQLGRKGLHSDIPGREGLRSQIQATECLSVQIHLVGGLCFIGLAYLYDVRMRLTRGGASQLGARRRMRPARGGASKLRCVSARMAPTNGAAKARGGPS
ncbi:hypothetical protein U9M48_043476 [Paspalum notatum var. saurae]|uniref:Uncharacterized protein n=1 Tax=Paspalum notatum var. saurae TaxID=547442 RepID=A0AAQ3UTK2_PASNO